MDLIKKLIKLTGLWLYPIGLVIEAIIIKSQWTHFYYDRKPPSHDTYMMWLLLPLAPCFFKFLKNLGKEEEPDVTGISERKKKAMYPKVPNKYLSNRPEGIILGKYVVNRKKRKNKYMYVRFPLNVRDIVHIILFGASGVGKSSSIFFPSLISNFMKAAGEQFACYVIDCKNELRNCAMYTNPKVRIINLEDRSSWGWDVYYQVNEKTTPSQMLRILKGIGRSLITGKEEDKFFVQNGIKMFCGLMLYYWQRKLGFLDSLIALMDSPIEEQLETIFADTAICKQGSKVRGLLNSFRGRDSDAVQDIQLQMYEQLECFLDDSVIWSLRDCPRKCNPRMLSKGISIFNCTPEDLIDDMSAVFKLQIYQLLDEMQNPQREKKDTIPCAIFIDEAYRIGKIEQLKKALATV